MTLNLDLADKKILSSLTFLSIISSDIDHVTSHVIVFVKKAKILQVGDGFKRKHQTKTRF